MGTSPCRRLLRTFVAVARSGSLRHAAFAMDITQAAASKQVSALEALLDTRLFDRHGRGMRLTSTGQRLLADTGDGFDRIDAALAGALGNDPDLSRRADHLLCGLAIPVAHVPFRSCGSDDFSEYGQVVPSLMSFIGVGSEGGVGLHHPKFLPGRSALRLSAVALASNYVAAVGLLRS